MAEGAFSRIYEVVAHPVHHIRESNAGVWIG